MIYVLLWAETKIKIHMLPTRKDTQEKINNLLNVFNDSSDCNSFTGKVIPTDQQIDVALKAKNIFTVLSRIAGGDDQMLSEPMKDKLKESGFFMRLVDKLLDLIYSVADKIHGPIVAEGGRETLVQQTCSKVMDWTQYGAARNRSLSLPELTVDSL